MANLHNPTRMCVCCRKRNHQKNLIRLQCREKKLIEFSKKGRSFYICKECYEGSFTNKKQEIKLLKILCKECKNKDDYIFQLKEILTYVRYS